ncbi:ribonuclease T2 family protein [Sulfitobacter donghicola]|uniref:Ribonuclease T2 n=1 Tax=Sulfitobacter donghicola DSW-25 = KCTC 12864 = JCM 14565 TaxID=1300350 RepID=A0A073IN60_9RHOB|nr:ribonuclease T2 [Sulfitobacter donghicola]KEJ90926.1 ribonuclease T2 [Sulfitobacter donghicola DSW-25 = KCTC 12864 = JCM 14565]KIN68214.1 Ribonuclease T2 family protein [Sulfitobacter donghicola DSW-25 = KCTC 12864 = JCM 14565]
MRRFFLICLLSLAALPAFAKGERAGEFDYYVVALSWSANWCALEGDTRNSPQCDDSEDHGWILHGLWPQFHQGYPSYCQTAKRPPSRGMTADMADIMGTGGLAWHQWNKHGSCTDLSASDYYDLSRRAYGAITRPAIFRKLDRTVKLPASVVEDAFIKDNPNLTRDSITITCRQGYIQEARICMSRDLEPVPCGRDVIKDCTLKDAVFTPLR